METVPQGILFITKLAVLLSRSISISIAKRSTVVSEISTGVTTSVVPTNAHFPPLGVNWNNISSSAFSNAI